MTCFTVGGVPMPLPIIVGAGVCKYVSQLAPYLRSDLSVGAIVLGSITPEPRAGNQEEPLQWPDTWDEFNQIGFGLNSFGMPNAGFERVRQELGSIFCPHPLIVSIAGFSVADFVAGVRMFQEMPAVSALELNFGCPNTHEQKKVPIAYDLDDMRAILDGIRALDPCKPVWIKLSPYLTAQERDFYGRLPHGVPLVFERVPIVERGFVTEVLDAISGYAFVRAVIFANTEPNVVAFDPKTGKPATGPNQGQAGLSGDLLRNIVKPLICTARADLPDSIDVIGCGGALVGSHFVEYFNEGAQAVQAVSGPSWYGNGLRFFAKLIENEALQEYLAGRME